MADTFQYPVFFECPCLDEEQRKKIENYFRIRRKSGGGDCGSVTNITDKVYSIAFKDRDAQQRVLQTCEHVFEFASGLLKLTVRGSPGPTSESVAPKWDTASSQQQPISPPSPQTSGEAYDLKLDPYLLHYLNECPKAEEELEKELASVACSARLYPEEGRVVVRRLAQPGAADDVRNWKVEIDKLFHGYTCHFELDPLKIKALLQSCRSGQAPDEVRVYSEVGMAIVVGKHSWVNARLVNVGDSCAKQAPRLTEKQTTTRRLGEAKLRLLWKDIEGSLGRDCPGLKVTQVGGQLVLEGSVNDILKAGDLISNKESLVLEKKVSDKSPHFLDFLKTDYGGPSALADFLGVGGKVEIELRDTGLRFFSFSADKVTEAEKKLKEKFKEVKVDVPNCFIVPRELQVKLKSKTNELNQGQCRVQVVLGQDSTLHLLGHSKEVEELSEVVRQFILDKANVEEKVIVPFPELVPVLSELLKQHKFDYSGVTLHPLTSSDTPMVVLEGPLSKVTEVRNRLGPFLDSVVQDTVTIDLPGAGRYFTSPSGRENILKLSQSQKCLIQFQGQPRITRQNLASSYKLNDGLQVLVCQGDITKLNADALVNAANEDLDHCGGVSAALSKAGGPQVQKESSALVKQTGKIPTGHVVVTTGGDLNCKKLLHAVGPIGGKVGGRERVLVEKTIQSTLNLAEIMAFKSIAMPCISSGVFGVPVPVCSEAIATAVKKFGSQGGRSLSKIILIDNRGEVVRALQSACDRLLQGNTIETSVAARENAAGGATAGTPGDGVHVEIVQGTIETQQVDGLVSPMAGHDPLSTRIGNVLSNLVGHQLTAKFQEEAGGVTLPGDSVLVEGFPPLQCKGLFFLNLIPWDNNEQGTAVQVLRQGIRRILASCESRNFRSVALPVLGIGALLRFPHSVASKVVLEEVRVFEQKRSGTASFLIRVVIHPSNKESSKAFQSAQETFHFRGFTNDANPDQASFYRHVSLTNDEVTAMLGGVKLQMVRGDIIHEHTDVIVNTTDFSNKAGVSKAIMTAAGPAVQAELAQLVIPADSMCTTGPGLLNCSEIIHASFNRDAQTIRKCCRKILKQCESKGYHSAAFPAINTGVGCMEYDKACKAMLDGMTSAITDLKPKSLSLIRIVILLEPVFQAFRSELEKRFGQTATRHLNLREKAKQKLKQWQDKYSRTSTTSAPGSKAFTPQKPLPAVISVIGCSRDTIRSIKRDLEGILQKQLVEREVDVLGFSKLDAMELEAVQAKIEILKISLECRRRQSSDGVSGNRAVNTATAEYRAQSGSGGDVCVLRGLKEDVLSVIELINRAIQKALWEDLHDKEEALMALNVQWSIQDVNGVWQELSLRNNYLLEEAHIKNEVSVDMTSDSLGVKVNLRTKEATDWQTGITYKVKRSESATTLKLPEQWEPMEAEVFKKVELQPNSPEYQAVAAGFLNTAAFNICKIERVQNFYLWNAYAVCKQRILAKNGAAHIGEMSLYHGTSAESCNLIEKGKFDRNFAGKHATAYGKGVYFAVNASYSAKGFSPADSSGLRRLYVARVLTGRYTVGKSSTMAPPPRGSDPTDCFDSVVDNQQQPSMFVIFHDDQAYPEYLITFK